MVETVPRSQCKLGRRNIVEATEQRLRYLDLLDALKMRPGVHTLEERILESVRVYRALLKRKHRRNQAAAYIEREIKQHGPREALIRTIRRGKKTDGLMIPNTRGWIALTSRSQWIAAPSHTEIRMKSAIDFG
jgi:hypothetical protein